MDEVKNTGHKLAAIEERQRDLNDAKVSFNRQIDSLKSELRDKDDFIQQLQHKNVLLMDDNKKTNMKMAALDEKF